MKLALKEKAKVIIEYALILILVIMVVIAAIAVAGPLVQNIYSTIYPGIH